MRKAFFKELLPVDAFYSSLLVGFLHYSYFLTNLIKSGSSLSEAITTLVDKGIFFVVIIMNTWLLLSFLCTPLFFLARKKLQKRPFVLKSFISNLLLSFPVTFILLLIMLILHSLVGKELSI